MKGRSLGILAAVVVVLVVLALVLHTGGQSKAPASGISLHGYTQSTVSQVTMQRGSTSILLTGSGNSWQANGKPAADSQVKALFSALQSAKVGDLVSKNPKNLASYGLSTGTGLNLSIESNGQTRTYVVGNQAPDGQSFYMKRDSSKYVFEVSGTLQSTVTAPLSSWQQAAPAKSSAASKSGVPLKIAKPAAKSA